MKNKTILFLMVVIILLSLFLSACKTAGSFLGVKDSDMLLLKGIGKGNLEMINEAKEDGADISKFEKNIYSKPSTIWYAYQNSSYKKTPEFLMENGADVNIPDTDGTTLLMWMANCTRIDSCKLLIKHGAKINEENIGYTALEYALEHNSNPRANEKNVNDIVTLLLNHGAKIRPVTLKAALRESKFTISSKIMYGVKRRILEGLLKAGYKSGISPIVEAAILGKTDKVDKYIKDNRMKKEDEQNVLFSTAAYGQVQTMELLKSKGIDIAFCDEYKYTPLIVAAFYGNLSMVKFLIDQGVDLEIRTNDADSQKTALNYAVENNQYIVVKYLIEKGANVKPYNLFAGTVDLLVGAASFSDGKMIQLILDSKYPLNRQAMERALQEAVRNCNIDAFTYLVDSKRYLNSNKNYYTMFLKDVKDIDTIKYFVGHGANVDGENGDGEPIKHACQEGQIDIVRYLLDHGANVNATNDSYNGKTTTLMSAVSNGNFPLVKLLVEYGADLEFENGQYDKNTPLIYAAFSGSRHILEYLIQKGANINYQNQKGQTALMLAATYGWLDNVKILVKYNADLNLEDKEGHTALDLAKANRNTDIVKLLRSVR